MTTKPSSSELRDLVAELKPRSPQEVMGAAASSNLMASMLTATLTATALVVGATVLMFSLGFGPTASQETVQANANQSDATEGSTNTDLDQKAATELASGSSQDPEEMANASASAADAGATENAIEAMGIGEAADPNSEPESLENRLDQILDGLE